MGARNPPMFLNFGSVPTKHGRLDAKRSINEAVVKLTENLCWGLAHVEVVALHAANGTFDPGNATSGHHGRNGNCPRGAICQNPHFCSDHEDDTDRLHKSAGTFRPRIRGARRPARAPSARVPVLSSIQCLCAPVAQWHVRLARENRFGLPVGARAREKAPSSSAGRRSPTCQKYFPPPIGAPQEEAFN